jgi:hypothetical protein
MGLIRLDKDGKGDTPVHRQTNPFMYRTLEFTEPRTAYNQT